MAGMGPPSPRVMASTSGRAYGPPKGMLVPAASTTLPRSAPPVVDGLAKPGHDTMGTTVPASCYVSANGDTPGQTIERDGDKSDDSTPPTLSSCRYATPPARHAGGNGQSITPLRS